MIEYLSKNILVNKYGDKLKVNNRMICIAEEMKHRLLHEFTRDEIKSAFDQADVNKTGYLRSDQLKNAIGYLNLHLPNRRIIESI